MTILKPRFLTLKLRMTSLVGLTPIRFFIIVGIILFSYLSVLPTFGQTNRYIDSLEQALAKKNHDTIRVSLLTSLANSYTLIDYKKSVAYAQEAMAIVDRIDDHRLKRLAFRSMSLIYFLGGDYVSALDYEAKSLQIAVIRKDSTQIGLSYSNMGNYYHEMGVYDEAYYYLTRAYSLLKTGEVSKGDSVLMNIVLHNVGRVFKELGQYETALQHLRLSQQRSVELDDVEGHPYALDEIGDVMLRMSKYDSALIYLEQALMITRELLAENPESLVKELKPKTLIKLANVFMMTGDFINALKYYDSTYRLYNLTNNHFGIAEVDLGRGTIYLKSNDFEKAERYIYGALNKAKSINARILEIKCYTQLALYWEIKGDYKRSLEYYKQHKSINDSLFSTETLQKLFRDQIRFATESKDDQIEALTRLEEFRKSELKKQELISNIFVVITALSAILLFTVYRSGQRRKQINKLLLQHQEEMKKRSIELEQLNQVKDKFFSIISHDLRSPINALAGVLDLINKGAIENHELPTALSELRVRFNHTRALLNNLLDWTLIQMDKLNLKPTRINLTLMVDENIEMMRSLQTKKLNFINSIQPGTFALADTNTVNLVIRNLVSNATKFTNEGGTIQIAAEGQGNEWVISVADNGIGMSPEVQSMLFDKTSPYSTRGTANERGTGLGLMLCKEFVEKNQGHIWVQSTEGQGSTFWFTLPKAS